ncbi:MAG: hypothetical protein ACREOB_04090 [Thermodesulfobacteriota bacterium]
MWEYIKNGYFNNRYEEDAGTFADDIAQWFRESPCPEEEEEDADENVCS